MMKDASLAPKQRSEQEGGNMTGKGIQQEDQGGQKQVMGIHFDYDSGLSVETTRNTVDPPRTAGGNTCPFLLNPKIQDVTEDSGHHLGRNEVSAATMDSRVSTMETSLNN